MTTGWSTINISGTTNYRTFSIQKWQTSFNFNLQHLIFMVESWLALLTAVPLVSFDIGLAIGFRKVGIGFLAPNGDITENLFVLCDESLENLAHLWSFSTLSFLQGNFLWVRRAYHKPCWHSLMWSVLLISVGQLLMSDDVLYAGSKQEWGEWPAELNCEAQSTAVSLCLGTSRFLWNAPLFRAYEGEEGINQLMVELLWQLMQTQVVCVDSSDGVFLHARGIWVLNLLTCTSCTTGK